MAPRASTRGRPAKAAAVAPDKTSIDAPKRRGRPTKEAAVAVVVPALQKKRGRPCKVQVAAEEAVAEEVKPRARRGRPAAKAAPEPAPAPQPKKRAGRPAQKDKNDVQEAVATNTAPKRRGRPAKNAVASPTKKKAKESIDLSRVSNRLSSRVTKRTPTKKPAAPPVPRMHPHLRSKLRARVAPAAELVEDIKPTKIVKNAVAKPTKKKAKAAKKTPERTRVTKAATPAKSRKRRGFTNIEVPDKHVAFFRSFLSDLVQQGKAEAGQAEQDAEMADDEQEVVIKAEPEDVEMADDEQEMAAAPEEPVVIDLLDGEESSSEQQNSIWSSLPLNTWMTQGS
jgi:hypothetical protein